MAKAAKEGILSDTQDLAELLIDAEVKLGEMLADVPDFHSSGKGTMKRKDLPDGVNKKTSHIGRIGVKGGTESLSLLFYT